MYNIYISRFKIYMCTIFAHVFVIWVCVKLIPRKPTIFHDKDLPQGCPIAIPHLKSSCVTARAIFGLCSTFGAFSGGSGGAGRGAGGACGAGRGSGKARAPRLGKRKKTVMA